MTRAVRRRPAGIGVGMTRIAAALFVIALLLTTYADRVALGDGNPFDYFGYFTNQTSLLAAAVVLTTGAISVRGRRPPPWLANARGILVSCLIVVAVIYNGLVPGTGTAPPWVSAILHVWFPLFVLLDWLLVGDRDPLPWRRLWLVLPYPLVWLAVVLVRGATDGWVPYGFLLPERGVLSLLGCMAALAVTLVAAGAVVWAGSRVP